MPELSVAAIPGGVASPGHRPDGEPAVSGPLLAVNGIEVIYNHVILVLKGVSLAVPEGRIVALLGGNGAGKTTTLRAISNLLAGERGEVTKGSIEYRGEPIARLSPAELVIDHSMQVDVFGSPREGNVTDEVRIFDAGTEVDQPLGQGSGQPLAPGASLGDGTPDDEDVSEGVVPHQSPWARYRLHAGGDAAIINDLLLPTFAKESYNRWQERIDTTWRLAPTEDPLGKAEYVAAQRGFAEHGAILFVGACFEFARLIPDIEICFAVFSTRLIANQPTVEEQLDPVRISVDLHARFPAIAALPCPASPRVRHVPRRL